MEITSKYYKQTEYLLYKYKMFKISIENMNKEIEFIRREDGSRGIGYDGISSSPTNQFSSATEDTALSNIEKIDYLEHSIRRIGNKIERIDRTLEGLTEEEKKIISGRYIEGHQWYIVAYEVGYSERHCKRLRNEAIEKIIIGLHGGK